VLVHTAFSLKKICGEEARLTATKKAIELIESVHGWNLDPQNLLVVFE